MNKIDKLLQLINIQLNLIYNCTLYIDNFLVDN